MCMKNLLICTFIHLHLIGFSNKRINICLKETRSFDYNACRPIYTLYLFYYTSIASKNSNPNKPTNEDHAIVETMHC